MLIVALVLAVVGLAALVTAVVTSNELVAWVCIAASVIGVILLIVDAIRERSQRTAAVPAEAGTAAGAVTVDDTYQNFDAEYPDEAEPAPTLDAEAEPEAESEADPETETSEEPEPEPEAGSDDDGTPAEEPESEGDEKPAQN